MFNDFLTKLEENGMEIFAYADDLAIHAYDLTKLETAIDIIERWVQENNMKINKKKSGIMFHKKRITRR